MFRIVNLYGEPLTDQPTFTSYAEAEAVVRQEWAKGWEVYVQEWVEDEGWFRRESSPTR